MATRKILQINDSVFVNLDNVVLFDLHEDENGKLYYNLVLSAVRNIGSASGGLSYRVHKQRNPAAFKIVQEWIRQRVIPNRPSGNFKSSNDG